MKTADTRQLLTELEALRIELEALGFSLDSQGSREAADVALTTSARVGELCADYATPDFFLPTGVRSAPVGSLTS